MPDLKDDLAALRIEREPHRPGRRWVPWLVVIAIVAAGGVGAWRWLTRERPVEV